MQNITNRQKRRIFKQELVNFWLSQDFFFFGENLKNDYFSYIYNQIL